MDAELKAKWVKALRSGEYKQTDNELRRVGPGGGFLYCCLGVLCDTMGADWIRGTPAINKVELEDQDECLLSEYALRLTGLNQGIQNALATMNDAGTPFPEIADYIESNL